MNNRDWPRHARALDLWLAGKMQTEIAREMGISRERVRQMLAVAGRRLAYRVFEGVPKRHWAFDKERGWWTCDSKHEHVGTCGMR